MRITVKILAFLVTLPATIAAADKPKTTPKIDVLFSPRGGCTDRIIEEIGKATKMIHVQKARPGGLPNSRSCPPSLPSL